MLHRGLLLAILLASACTATQSPPGEGAVTLRAQPAAVSAGDSLELVLENGLAEPVGYNLCTSALEWRRGEAWEAVASDRVCTMELRILEPGQEARFTFAMPQRPQLPAGEYRAVTGVEHMTSGGRTEVASEPFRVE